MSGVANHKVIDVIAETGAGDVLLIMTEGRAWGGESHLHELRAKLNTYMNYILQGALVADHPQYEGRKTFIALFCAEPPNVEAHQFLEFVTTKNADLGVPFAVEIKPDMFTDGAFTGGGMLG